METIGQYKIIQSLSKGKDTEVLLAEEPDSAAVSRRLAIKRILPGRANDAELVEIFLKEARYLALLNHPNIATLYDLGETGGDESIYYTVMEYVQGFDLGQILNKSKDRGEPLSSIHIASVLGQVAVGLHYVHAYCSPQTGKSLCLLHRNINPSNIMVSLDGTVKILDFEPDPSITSFPLSPIQKRMFEDKIPYLSPEFLRGEGIDSRHDLFALGVVMYELATGHKPFHAKGDVQTIHAILKSSPRNALEFNPDLPVGFVDIMNRLLEKDPSNRFQTGDEVKDAIDSFLKAEGLEGIGFAQVAEYLQRLSSPSSTEELLA